MRTRTSWVMAAAAIAAGAYGGHPKWPEFGATLAAQQVSPELKTPRSPYMGPTPAPSPVERISRDVVRIGTILVDTSKKELTVGGVMNDASVLEFLANTKGGWKAYESAFEMDTNAVNFNVACLLIGLDNVGAVPSRFQFDPQPPQGHPVDMFIEWEDGGKPRRVRAEQLLYNKATKETLPEGPWVYTGSVFQPENRYAAEVEGTLIGFMHTVAPIIENPRPLAGAWGDTAINPGLNLKPGTQMKLIVRALPKPAR